MPPIRFKKDLDFDTGRLSLLFKYFKNLNFAEILLE